MNDFGGKFWDERYSATEFIYGTEPNNFFRIKLDKLTPGKILLLGEGEGRNAVHAALNGWEVDAVDFSTRAKEKALQLALDNDVLINYEVVDLSNYKPKQNYYDAVAIIYLHLIPELRQSIHLQVVNSLYTGGKLILEVFEKEQLDKSSGGPQSLEMLYSKEELKTDFVNMKIKMLEKQQINLDESEKHRGDAVVIRMIAEKANR
ncbi:MAG: class I SAM-dependent methyltransferase [Ignavibacterium sp.]|nr:MAG: class I SAM-dependent methyltransferase [Ignavibacterium sp.]